MKMAELLAISIKPGLNTWASVSMTVNQKQEWKNLAYCCYSFKKGDLEVKEHNASITVPDNARTSW